MSKDHIASSSPFPPSHQNGTDWCQVWSHSHGCCPQSCPSRTYTIGIHVTRPNFNTRSCNHNAGQGEFDQVDWYHGPPQRRIQPGHWVLAVGACWKGLPTCCPFVPALHNRQSFYLASRLCVAPIKQPTLQIWSPPGSKLASRMSNKQTWSWP